MRFLAIAIAAALQLPLVIAPAQACGGAAHSAKAASIDPSAMKYKKKMRKTEKAKKAKVEYMRAAPM